MESESSPVRTSSRSLTTLCQGVQGNAVMSLLSRARRALFVLPGITTREAILELLWPGLCPLSQRARIQRARLDAISGDPPHAVIGSDMATIRAVPHHAVPMLSVRIDDEPAGVTPHPGKVLFVGL